MNDKATQLTHKYEANIISYRRRIHQNPELAFGEHATSALVKEVLTELDIPFQEIGTGVVGHLQGAKPGKTIALRADMDALPLTEKTGLPYASKNNGVMHACGHDMHTATLLGCAHIFNELKDTLQGSIKFVFQPAEESNPNCGALQIIKGGGLDGVDGIVGLHVWPAMETGFAGTRVGTLMGASDRIFIKIYGKSSHGSEPDAGIDAILISAQIITALQSIVSRKVSPLNASVISIGTMQAGVRYNVIADTAVLEGTVRNTDPGTRDKMPDRIERVIKGVCEAMDATYDFEYIHGYAPTVNEENQTKRVIATVQDLVGIDKFVHVEKPALGGEDFSFYGQQVPATFLWLGCRPEEIKPEDFPPIHNVGFQPDEACMRIGADILVQSALTLLG